MENVLLDALSGISSVIGIPATVGLCWVYFRFKSTEARVAQLEKLVEDDKARRAEELSRIYDKLNLLVSDVSFIKGRLFKDE